MSPAFVSALAGTSGLIGLLALMAYFFYSCQVHKLEQSFRRTIDGESPGLINAEKVVDILRTFETPTSRLTALKQLIGVDDRAAKRVYGKIEGSVNPGKWTDQDSKKRARTSLRIGLFFVLIALIGPNKTANAGPTGTASPTSTPTPEWMLETSQRRWAFVTEEWGHRGRMQEKTYSSQPLDDNHQLRNPRVAFDNLPGVEFSNLRQSPPPEAYITPDGRSVAIRVKSWGPSFTFYLLADVYKRSSLDGKSTKRDRLFERPSLTSLRLAPSCSASIPCLSKECIKYSPSLPTVAR